MTTATKTKKEQMVEAMLNEDYTRMYANWHLHSDVKPYEIIERKSKTQMVVREMDAKIHEDFKPDMVATGFSAQTLNNHDQEWVYTSNPKGDVRIIRFSKAKFGWYDKNGNRHVVSENPVKFHDYNF